MLRKISDVIRFIILIITPLIFLAFCSVKLMEIQIVNGGNYLKQEDKIYKTTQSLSATRGQIIDAKGNPIVGNTTGFNVNISEAYFPSDNQAANRIILSTVKILQENDIIWNDLTPVSLEKPYEYSENQADVDTFIKKININTYATAENCIDKLIDDYDISDEYTDTEKRIIAGIRYSMFLQDFSMRTNFILSDNVSPEVVLKIKERRVELLGIDCTEVPIRQYLQTDFLPHEIGVVSKIYAEDYEKLKEEGYALNDVTGKGGLEENLESYLRGSKGEVEITVVNGEVTQTEVITPAVAGDTVKLTVDPEFQRAIQQVMEDYLVMLKTKGKKYDDVQAGAIVVLDVKTGAVLALGTLPTYDILDYTENYTEFMKTVEEAGINTPLINRATDGLYRPGSTFKTVTATAGLNEGVIKRNSTFYCGHKYNYLGTVMGCTGTHGSIAVERALTKSCNIYFYQLVQKLGVDKLAQYETHYGLGQTLGLESGDSAGWLATPETFEKNGWDWNSGLLLQAAIGQSEIAVTPLQMATIASTIANRGTRLVPHIVDTIYNYNQTEVILKKEREVAEQIDVAYPEIYDYIINGMIGAAKNTPYGEYSLNNLGFQVAIKTGTPQSNHPNGTSSAFIGFAPVEDPQIAFAGIFEGGEYSKYTVRKIIDAYQAHYGAWS